MCINCAALGISIDENQTVCRLCHTISTCVRSSDSCEHLLCANCYRFSAWESKNYFDAKFPYPPNLEEEYDLNEDDEKWDHNSLIVAWRNQLQNVCDAANFIVESVIEEASECQICKEKTSTGFTTTINDMKKDDLAKVIIAFAVKIGKSKEEDEDSPVISSEDEDA